MKPRTVALAAASERCAPPAAAPALPRRSAHALARAASALLALLLAAPLAAATRYSVQGGAGLSATLDAGTGRYEIADASLGWVFAGRLGDIPRDVATEDGRDEIGAYRELRFRWRAPALLSGSIRTYLDSRVVLLSVTTTQATPNDAAVRFPEFVELPPHLRHFSYGDSEFAPPVFALEETASPWLLFDDKGTAAIVSPAGHFMSASLFAGRNGAIAGGIGRAVRQLPAHFTQATLVAFASGVNAAWDSWGAALVRLTALGERPGADADASLRYLGYWTDNGAYYYYNYDPGLGYGATLESLVQHLRARGVPVRYLQLDSWWYYKSFSEPGGRRGGAKNPALPEGEWNRYGGLLRYEAHPGVLPEGLAAFQRRLDLPLLTHNRWIDPASPYHANYHVSGFAALDPRWWADRMHYLAEAGVVTYEQDWLSVIYRRSPELSAEPAAGEAFMDEMADAARARGLTLQYCMGLPRHFLQGARYPNLTSIRVSPDRFERSRWDGFLYTSRLASALGIWPFSDVLMSSEADNLLLATLSAGPVGIGDRIGSEDRDTLARAVRADGVLVKPDAPLVPLDRMYGADARHAPAPMIASTFVAHAGLRSVHLIAYARDARDALARVTPRELGVGGDAYLYDASAGTAARVRPDAPLSLEVRADALVHLIVVPVARSGVALVGDTTKFVPDGRTRIASLIDAPGELTVTVSFAPEERVVRLFGYAPQRPLVAADTGATGEVLYESASGRFEVAVFPETALLTEGPGSDPVRHAVLTLRLQ
jgi:hypothetical protein